MKRQEHGEGCPPAQPTLPETNPSYPERLQALIPLLGSWPCTWPPLRNLRLPQPHSLLSPFSLYTGPGPWGSYFLRPGTSTPPRHSPARRLSRPALTVPAGPFDEAGGRLELEGVQVAVPAGRGRYEGGGGGAVAVPGLGGPSQPQRLHQPLVRRIHGNARPRRGNDVTSQRAAVTSPG